MGKTFADWSLVPPLDAILLNYTKKTHELPQTLKICERFLL